MRERDDVTAERNEDVKEVYWYSAEIVFSNLGFHLGFFFFFFFFYRMELEFAKLQFHVLKKKKKKIYIYIYDIRFMLVGTGAGKLIFLAGTRVPKTVQLTN